MKTLVASIVLMCVMVLWMGNTSITMADNDGQREDVLWVQDALPAGAKPGLESWTWISSNPAPYSGELVHESVLSTGIHQYAFTGATDTLKVNPGDILIAYVYLDPDNPPSEIMLQWHDGSWEHRAYWGANNIDWGVDGTERRLRIGDLPLLGQWVRLEVSASLIGLEGSTLTGMAFTLYDGRATWDNVGKTVSHTYTTNTTVATTIPTTTPTPEPSPLPLAPTYTPASTPETIPESTPVAFWTIILGTFAVTGLVGAVGIILSILRKYHRVRNNLETAQKKIEDTQKQCGKPPT